jgi:hypothetical protein
MAPSRTRRVCSGGSSTAAGISGKHNCTVLAECCAVLGQVELGLAMIDKAISSMNRSDQRMTEPKTWRVKGSLLQNKSSTPACSELERQAALREAEDCYREAITVARAQESKTWELRATASLTRLVLNRATKQMDKSSFGRSVVGSRKALIPLISSRPELCCNDSYLLSHRIDGSLLATKLTKGKANPSSWLTQLLVACAKSENLLITFAV